MSKIPAIQWYQRTDKVYIHLFNVGTDGYTLEMKGDTLTFYNDTFRVETQLHEEVELDTHENMGRILKIVCKKTGEGTFWPRLTTNPALNKSHVRVDWQNWQDEDELEDESSDEVGDNQSPDMGGGGMPDMASLMAQMGGMEGMMKGMGGMGGMEELMKGMAGQEGAMDSLSDTDSETEDGCHDGCGTTSSAGCGTTSSAGCGTTSSAGCGTTSSA